MPRSPTPFLFAGTPHSPGYVVKLFVIWAIQVTGTGCMNEMGATCASAKVTTS
jgi:hypothetical protein